MSDYITMNTLASMARQKGWPGPQNSYQVGRLRPIPWSELHDLPKRDYLVKGLLDKEGMSVIYGESNCGKTFLALDIALHIAQGKPWRGQKVRQGAVVYIAAEGGMGLQDRLDAFRAHYKLTEYPPFHLVPVSVDFCNSEDDVEELIDEISDIPNVDLIVIDTLSRAMAGGDENSSTDMGAAIRSADRLKEELSTHVMFIHHCGKDATRGARGHSSLRAAVDTEIEVKRSLNSIEAVVKKQRDGKTDGKHVFALCSISLGMDEDGEPKNSCVLTPSVGPLVTEKPLKGQAKKAFDALRQVLEEKGQTRNVGTGSSRRCVHISDLQNVLKDSGFCKPDKKGKTENLRTAIRRSFKTLENGSFIVVYDDYICLPDKVDK